MDTPVARLLRDFAASSGLTGLELNAESRAALRFDEKITVNFQQSGAGNELILYTDLGEIPSERHALMLEAMLRGNLFWQGTRGATLALQGDPGQAVLMLEVDAGPSSAPEFRIILDQFVNTAEAWQEFIRGEGEFASIENESEETRPIPEAVSLIRA